MTKEEMKQSIYIQVMSTGKNLDELDEFYLKEVFRRVKNICDIAAEVYFEDKKELKFRD